jgi:hypothetical protein
VHRVSFYISVSLSIYIYLHSFSINVMVVQLLFFFKCADAHLFLGCTKLPCHQVLHYVLSRKQKFILHFQYMRDRGIKIRKKKEIKNQHLRMGACACQESLPLRELLHHELGSACLQPWQQPSRPRACESICIKNKNWY